MIKTRIVLGLFLMIKDKWQCIRIYGNAKPRTLKHARKYAKYKFPRGARWKTQKIYYRWEEPDEVQIEKEEGGLLVGRGEGTADPLGKIITECIIPSKDFQREKWKETIEVVPTEKESGDA